MSTKNKTKQFDLKAVRPLIGTYSSGLRETVHRLLTEQAQSVGLTLDDLANLPVKVFRERYETLDFRVGKERGLAMTVKYGFETAFVSEGDHLNFRFPRATQIIIGFHRVILGLIEPVPVIEIIITVSHARKKDTNEWDVVARVQEKFTTNKLHIRSKATLPELDLDQFNAAMTMALGSYSKSYDGHYKNKVEEHESTA